MILRGPLLSENRFALLQLQGQSIARVEKAQSQGLSSGATNANPSDSKALAKAEASETQSNAKSETKSDGLRMIETSHPQAISAKNEPAERLLSFEKVVAWLAVQDAETRSACAAILASEVTQTHEAAKNDGFAAGCKAGEAAAAKEAKPQLDALRQLVVAADKAFAQEQVQMQDVCVDIVAEALTKIAGPLLASEAAVIGMVREVLARVKEGREIVVRVARGDLPALRKYESEVAATLSGRKLELLADARVELGGCIVESKLGNLDGRLEVQLRELYETLRLAKSSTPEIV